MNVYIIPIRNWPDTDNMRWYLEDDSCNIVHCVSFATPDEARAYAKEKGWNLPDEESDENPPIKS